MLPSTASAYAPTSSTTYTILAGLATVPGDVLEAAKMDGAGPARTYWDVVLPQLRGALSVAVLINIINVFNSLTILKVMTGSIPGYDAAAFNLSFAVWIMHSFFAGVPKEIDEAAQIDGAGRLAVLFRIMLPLVWPGIVTAIVFTFVACWNEFAASLVILSTAGDQPLSVALTKFVGQYETSWHYVFGVSIVAIIPVVVLFMLIEKRLVGGLTAGSVT
ncbi:hypothetical protein GCM10023152_23800 [Agromyces bauzanensis]|uniref:ABC transmembrane type-1 domain-containing protein n=1 Tax=Agromyces bauzanensis TaxID=1308924 RepID=A0A917PG27_9MICO|nr:carbohydrate ABC transporter permease [Agromyces bauzanensis]GGJ75656.1 hypothetical protein GCM10011372_12270 [Agromyces bauzanensis]